MTTIFKQFTDLFKSFYKKKEQVIFVLINGGIFHRDVSINILPLLVGNINFVYIEKNATYINGIKSLTNITYTHQLILKDNILSLEEK